MGARVAGLFRFPVKGMPAEPLAVAHARRGSGFDADRAVALTTGATEVVPTGEWVSYQHLTALTNDTSMQKWSTQAHVRPEGVDITIGDPYGDQVELSTDDPASMQRAHEFLTRRLATQGSHDRVLVTANQGLFDSKLSGVSFINRATVERLSETSGIELDPLRFRGNVLIDGLAPFAELDWIGRVVQIGELRLWIRSSIERCPATRLNPQTREVDVNVPRLLAAFAGHVHCGVYAVVLNDADVSVGDRIDVTGDPTTVPPDADPTWRKVVTGPRVATVVEREILDADIREGVVRLRLRDDLGWFAEHFVPGMHVRLHLDSPTGLLWRTYTVTAADGNDLELLTSVQGEGSRAVARLQPGDRVTMSGPFGRITTEHLQRPKLAVICAGIGATPAAALGEHCDRDVVALHVERESAPSQVHAWLTERLPSLDRWSTVERGRPSVQALFDWLRDRHCDANCDLVVCGPEGFSAVVREAAARIGIDDVWEEVFASPMEPDQAIAPPDLPAAHVWVGDHEFEWTPDDGFLLDACEANGIEVDSSCRGGSCGSCILQRVEGHVTYAVEPSVITARDDVVTCSAFPCGDLRLATPDT